jgi:hypothetical protein
MIAPLHQVSIPWDAPYAAAMSRPTWHTGPQPLAISAAELAAAAEAASRSVARVEAAAALVHRRLT